MAKRRIMGKKEFDSAWKAMAESDRRWISALILISEAIGDKKIRYRGPSASLRRSLRRLDRNTCYGVIAECLYLLLDAPVLERLKRLHRQREAKKRLSGAKKKKRVSAAKKKRRTKKPAPKRRTTRKRPAK